MKYFIIPFAVLLFSCSTTETKDKKNTEGVDGTGTFELPKTWNKDFSISLYEGGGMLNESETILFSADSCKYVHSKNNIDSVKRFTLTPKEKEEVLAKISTFNVGAIETVKASEITYDKESNSLCFTQGPQPSFCIETGGSTGIKESSQANFNGAYSYLWQLALAKSK